MASPQYQDNFVQAVSSQELALENLRNKSVVVTGGASGLGKAYVEGFANAGAYVTFGDIDESGGSALAARFPSNVQFVKCNVLSWEDQSSMFRAAVANSPAKSCDVVIANAGISGPDSIYQAEDVSKEPTKPDLRIIETNLIGVLYTTKLALHYFRLHAPSTTRDRCLIIKGSLAGYIDQPGSPQYNTAKWGGRGLMRSLRRTAPDESMRVNYVAPWFIRTNILSKQVQQHVESKGVQFALAEDACKAMMHIASDKTINGRAFAVVPRNEAPEGYMDFAHDDYQTGDVLKEWQEAAVMLSHRTAVSQMR